MYEYHNYIVWKFCCHKESITSLCSRNPASEAAGARCSSVVRAFDHGARGRRIDPSWGGPIELFLVPASAPRLIVRDACAILSVGMVHIKEPLLLIKKSSPCGGSGFPLSLSE